MMRAPGLNSQAGRGARIGRARRGAAAMVALALTLGLGACASGTNADIAKQANDQKGYVGGDGTVEELPAAKRAEPVTVSGTTLQGKNWDVKSERGKVVVLNVWGAWCGPCQGEMPHLEKAWKSYDSANKPVAFMGLDQRDSDAVASSTLKKWGVTFPSLANDDGQNLQGLQRKVVATPTTLVLDKQGRIAARVSGATTETTVRNMVDKVLAEKA